MATVTGINELETHMIKKIVDWYKTMQVKLPEYLKDFIYSEYYNKYTPSNFYERQYRIVDAIMVSNIKVSGKSVYMEIYLDPENASYDPSIWYYPDDGAYSYIKGDDPMTVWENMRLGIHGSEEFGRTDGDFWQAFVDSVNRGGIHDLFEDFKKYLGNIAGLQVR